MKIVLPSALDITVKQTGETYDPAIMEIVNDDHDSSCSTANVMDEDIAGPDQIQTSVSPIHMNGINLNGAAPCLTINDVMNGVNSTGSI